MKINEGDTCVQIWPVEKEEWNGMVHFNLLLIVIVTEVYGSCGVISTKLVVNAWLSIMSISYEKVHRW